MEIICHLLHGFIQLIVYDRTLCRTDMFDKFFYTFMILIYILNNIDFLYRMNFMFLNIVFKVNNHFPPLFVCFTSHGNYVRSSQSSIILDR